MERTGGTHGVRAGKLHPQGSLTQSPPGLSLGATATEVPVRPANEEVGLDHIKARFLQKIQIRTRFLFFTPERVRGTFWGCFLFQKKGEGYRPESGRLCLRVGDKLKARLPDTLFSKLQPQPRGAREAQPLCSPSPGYPPGPPDLEVTSDPHTYALPSLSTHR